MDGCVTKGPAAALEGQDIGAAGLLPPEDSDTHCPVAGHHPLIELHAGVLHAAHEVKLLSGLTHAQYWLWVVQTPASGVVGQAWSKPSEYWHVPVAGHQPLLQSEFEVHVPQS